MSSKLEKLLIVVSGAAAAYFTISTVLWALYFVMPMFKGRSIDNHVALQQCLIAVPCILLTAFFWVAVWQVLRRRSIAKYLIILGFVFSALLLWYDFSHERFQAFVFTENGDSHIYLTWWLTGNHQ